MHCSADPRPAAAIALLLLVATLAPDGRDAALDAAAHAPIARHRIDLATDDAPTLALLPGIGPARARAIVAHRREHGPWRSLEDLIAVPGLGPRLVARIAPHCTLPTADSPDPDSPDPDSPNPDATKRHPR